MMWDTDSIATVIEVEELTVVYVPEFVLAFILYFLLDLEYNRIDCY